VGTRDEELRVRATFDGSELKGGLDGVAAAGTAAGAAVAAGGAKAAEGLTAAIGPSAKLEEQIKKTANALSPRGIVDGAAKIRIALEDIEAHAKATGQAIGPELAAQMQRAEAAIAAAIPRAGRLADTIADTRKQAGLAAEGYKTLGVAGGGLQSVFGAMDDAGEGWVSTLGKMGIAAFGVGQAIGLARSIVQSATTAIQDHLNAQDALSRKLAEAKASQDKWAASTLLAQRGLIPFGATVEQTARNMDIYALASGRAGQRQKELAESAGVVIPNFKLLKDSAEVLGATMEGAFKRGNAEGLAFAQANEANLKAVEASFRALGEAVPVGVRKALDALAEVSRATKEFADEIKRLNEAYSFDRAASEARIKALRDEADARKASIDSLKASIEASKQSADAARDEAARRMKALNEENVSLEEYSKRKKEIYAEMNRVVDESADQEAAARVKLKPLYDAEVDAIQREITERQKITPVVEAQTQSMQALVDQMNAGTASVNAQTEAVVAQGESISAGDEAHARFVERQRVLAEETRKVAEQTNATTTQFGAFREALDITAEALERLTN